jgi:hypothetical protein
MLRACQGHVDEGRELYEQARETFRQAGLRVTAAGGGMVVSEIEWRAGDLDAQERVLRESLAALDELQDQLYFSTIALELVDCLLQWRTPDDEEVAALFAVARERTLGADLVNFVYLDGIEARRLAYEGFRAEGVGLARRTVETIDRTDNFIVRSRTWAALAETLHLAGEADEAGRAAAESIAIRLAKGDTSGAAALERRFELHGVQPA